MSILIPNKDHTDALEKCLYSIWSKTEWDNFEAVSYTHLDVYKRQGLRSIPIDRLGQIAPAFDTVVNTVPAPVLSEAVLARLRPQSFIVDLASRPGGTDFDAARRLGHRAIHALSLPAACAPETAGEAVARTVCDMIGQREEAS